MADYPGQVSLGLGVCNRPEFRLHHDLRMVEVDGAQMSVSAAARKKGLDPNVVLDRINKLNWSLQDALETPKLGKGAGPQRKRG